MIDLPNEADIIRTWKQIGVEIGNVSEDTAQRFADRNKDPLPVFHDHLGPFIHKTALRDWLVRQLRSHGRDRALRRHQAAVNRPMARRGGAKQP